MATKRISPQKKMNPQGPMDLLSAAICEWFLMFLLLLDATFFYIVRRFAEYCELPTPCLFCSRINALSCKRKFEGYNELLCQTHREEISSLVSCRVHGKLTDAREMCEECFMSMHDKSNSGSYMVGKLGFDIEQHRVQSFLLHKKISLTSSGTRICPCCNRSWGAKRNAHKFLELTPVGFGASKANVRPPLPRVPGRSRFSRRNSFRKHRDRLSAPVSPRAGELSHVGNTKLKFTSDTESEASFMGDEGVFPVKGRKYMNPEHDPHHVARSLLKLQTDDAVLEKQSNHGFADVTLLLDEHVKLETHKSLPTHGLEELNWDQLHLETKNPVSQEVLDDVIKAPSNESGEASIIVEPQPHMSSIDMLADLIPLNNTHPGSHDANQESLKSHDEDGMTAGQQPMNATSFSDGGVPYISNDINSTNSSAMTDEGKEVSNTPVELSSASGSIDFEDIKSVLQQSAAKKDDSHNVGASSRGANHVQGLNSLERNQSSLKLERVSLSDDMTVAQQSIKVTGFLDGGIPYILDDISSNISSAMSDGGKGASSPPVELPSARGSINFEDIKSVLQQTASNKDDSQNVDGASSPDANHEQNLTSLERTDSRFIFERVSLGDDMTLAQQAINLTCFSEDGIPYILNDVSSTNSPAMTDDGKEVSTTSVGLPSASGSTEFEDNKPVLQQSDQKQDDSQNVDASISDENQVQDLASLERNDISLKLEERMSVSDVEVEGESYIDILKSQIEHDKKCMNDLYKELEEERNAAAISANQAMAMITRLQEEKAALHMEALQYLRMMDEQAEYDTEALQKANDDLADKEKELQDLEYELGLYKNNTNGGSHVPNPHNESIIITMGGNTTVDSGVHLNGLSQCEPSSPVSSKMDIACDISCNAKSSMSNLSEEKLYLVEYLMQLERRIHEVSSLSNDQADGEKEADDSHMQNGFNVVDGTSSKDSHTHLIEDRDAFGEETKHNRSNMLNLSTSGSEPHIASLQNDFANFKERLKVFETDLKFIKHYLSAVQNGNDGLEHIQQIIDQLQELRNREFQKRCLSTP